MFVNMEENTVLGQEIGGSWNFRVPALFLDTIYKFSMWKLGRPHKKLTARSLVCWFSIQSIDTSSWTRNSWDNTYLAKTGKQGNEQWR
jgi:hypothetical protein